MKKTHSFLLTACLALAITFTLSCSSSDDNEEGTGACYVESFVPGADAKMCMAAEDEKFPMTKEMCDYASIETGYEVKFRKSCPSGYRYRLECEDEEDGTIFYFYFYGNDIPPGMTCEDLE
jgi:hypothetical protein